MSASSVGSVPAEFSRTRDIVEQLGVQGPMPQQDMDGCHGHEMHPQKFLRLVGCHESNPARREVGYRLH
jgi:hypothetical protein